MLLTTTINSLPSSRAGDTSWSPASCTSDALVTWWDINVRKTSWAIDTLSDALSRRGRRPRRRRRGPLRACPGLGPSSVSDEHESDWFEANVELMISRLKNDDWAELGLPGPITPAVDIGGSRTSVSGRVIAQARAGKAAAVYAAQAKAARAGALRSHTHKHTHIHSLCRRRRNVQVPCLARARAFTEGARAHAQSVWGRARLQVLNVASRRTRTRKVILILRRFRKVPSSLCICVVLPYAHVCNHLAYIAYLTYFCI